MKYLGGENESGSKGKRNRVEEKEIGRAREERGVGDIMLSLERHG